MRRSSLETSADSRLLGATLNNFLFGPRSHNAALFVFLIEYVLYPRKERVRPELRMHNPKKNTTKAAPARRGEQESLTTNKQKKKRWELLRQYTTVSSNSRSPENILTLLFFFSLLSNVTPSSISFLYLSCFCSCRLPFRPSTLPAPCVCVLFPFLSF